MHAKHKVYKNESRIVRKESTTPSPVKSVYLWKHKHVLLYRVVELMGSDKN